jgi:hypothetical protein
MSIENYLKTALSFAQHLEIDNNLSRFEYQNQPFQCGKNAEGFWLMAGSKGKDTPPCFECDSSLYDDEERDRLEEMWSEQSRINQSLQESFPNLRLIEEDNYFKLRIEYTEDGFFSANFENDCQIIIESAKSDQVRMFRNQFESLLD